MHSAFNSPAYALKDIICQRHKGAGGGYPSTGPLLKFLSENNAVSGIFELKLQLYNTF